MKRDTQRRGVMLTISVITMALVAGLIALLAVNAGQIYRQRRAEQLRLLAQEAIDSAVAYADQHRAEWARSTPDKPIELDMRAALPANISGTATLGFETAGGSRVCRITAQVSSAAWNAVREATVTIAPATTTTRTQPNP